MAKQQILVHPKSSYKIIGIAYNVHNKIGGGLKEKAYENAFALALEKARIQYKRQLKIQVKYLGTKVANRFLDFLIDDEIVVELKSGGQPLTSDIEQIHEYLKLSDLQLGIIINFGREDVRFKRIVNLNENS